MNLTVSLQEIKDAEQYLNITSPEAYLEQDDDVIYLHWVATRDEASVYVDNVYECLDIRIYGHWVDIHGQYERGMPVALPFLRDGDYFACRYIIASK